MVVLDQTRLPAEERELVCGDVPSLVTAIRRLAVRGAPLLGIAGAYGVALAAHAAERSGGWPALQRDAAALAAARPTAVNLPTSVARVLAAVDPADMYRTALAAARAVEAEDAAASDRLAAHGLTLVPDGARVLTHCNTGALVSGGEGTALAVVFAAHRAGRLARLWVDETRPLLQGARLTAYEAAAAGIPYVVLVDGAAGSLLASGAVDLVLVGADRIAADGSVANKVGTYPLAVLADRHGVPFVVVAPVSTVDLAASRGADLPVEDRPAEEVTGLAGVRTAPPGAAAYNPAFDVTPPELVTAIVTDAGVIRPPYGPGLSRAGRRGAEQVSP